MTGIKVEDRAVVVPGDTLAIGMKFLPGHGAHRAEEEIRSSVLGLASIKGSVIKVIPLSGAYIPQEGDKVIGEVVDIGHSNWEVEIRAPNTASLGIGDATRSYIKLGEDLSKYFAVGDYIYTKVMSVDEVMYTKLFMKDRMFKKLEPGMIVKIKPVKVPRVIGKKGSMINALKEATNCSYIVGQNGLVWIKGDNREDELLGAQAVKYIESRSHVKGLTDSISKKIGEWKNGKSKK